LSILIIEDDEELAAEIVEYLQRRGRAASAHRSYAAAEKALMEAIASNSLPRAILCDIVLPDGNGIDLFQAFAARMPATRWILASGDNDPAALAGVMKIAGVSPPVLVEKPIPLSDLDALVGGQD